MIASEPGLERIGHYRLIARIATGGMGIVYRAIAEGVQGFQRPVGLKRIRPELVKEPAFVRMLIDEGRISARLQHPNIAQVYELAEHDGEPFLVMEWIDGTDLARILKHCKQRGVLLPILAVAFIVREVAAALAYAHSLTGDHGHSLGIVHRDVSPSNIMVTGLGGVKLLDFGVARAIGELRDEQTRTGQLRGKLCYMSPEQADGRPVDARSDLFSLGIVFHEALTGQRLFGGYEDLQTLRMIREAHVEPPSRERADVPAELDDLVLYMLARVPDDRCPSAEVVMATLTRSLKHNGFDGSSMAAALSRLAIPPAPVERQIVTIPGPEPQVTRPLAPTPPAPMPSRAPAVAVGALLIACVIATAALIWLRTPAGEAVAPRRDPPAPREHETPPPVRSKPAAPPPPTPAPSPPKIAPVAPVRLTIGGTAGARVHVDGRMIGSLPLAVELPAAAGARRVLVTMPGMVSFRTTVRADVSTRLDVRLLPARKPAARPLELDGVSNPFQSSK